MGSDRSELIDKILKATGVEPTLYFDKLSDKSDSYLSKLFEVIKILQKNAL